jgi:hypothetical protein
MKRFIDCDLYKKKMKNNALHNLTQGKKPSLHTNLLRLTTIISISIMSSVAVNAQSEGYKKMENRFTKRGLSSDDSAAFRAQGIQKAQSLFDQTNLYVQNTGNVSNQTYIANRIPDLFYVPESEELDLEPLMNAIKKIQSSKKQAAPLFVVLPQKGYLGKIETTNTVPKLEFFLVLMQAPKRFGNKEEMVWQVFLAEPVVR